MVSPSELDDLISLNAGAQGRHLPCLIPIGMMINSKRCEAFQRQIETAADGKWEVLPAKAASASSVPKLPGIYMFVWHPTLVLTRSQPHSDYPLRYILYVGSTGADDSAGTLRERYRTYVPHFEANPRSLWTDEALKSRNARLDCFLSLIPLEFWFLACAEANLIDEIEARLIEFLNPPINARKEPVLRPTSTRTAFQRE